MRADRCRGCHSRDVVTLHDFGAQPLAGHFPLVPESVQPAPRYRLALSRCETCGLMQLLDLPPIGEVFHSDYRYSSSTVPGLVAHFDAYARWLAGQIRPGGRVFEFGCNDGVLLAPLRSLGVDCAGIDASANVAAMARARGLAVDTGFLDEEYARVEARAGTFDLVTCSNVFAHIHDLDATLRAVRLLLRDGGLFAVEVHDGDVLVRESQFDTIYHEHLTYFTEATLRSVLERSGLAFVRCERTPMHGGALRLLAAKVADADRVAPPLAVVRPAGAALGPVIERCRQDLVRLHREHGPLVGYGAAGRSQMFLNFTGTAGLFSRVHDDSPLRQGRYVAGTDLPIVPFAGERAPVAVVLAWNYAEHIARATRGSFDRVVTVLPELRSW